MKSKNKQNNNYNNNYSRPPIPPLRWPPPLDTAADFQRGGYIPGMWGSVLNTAGKAAVSLTLLTSPAQYSSSVTKHCSLTMCSKYLVERCCNLGRGTSEPLKAASQGKFREVVKRLKFIIFKWNLRKRESNLREENSSGRCRLLFIGSCCTHSITAS